MQKTMKDGAAVYEQYLKMQLTNALDDAFKTTFVDAGLELGDEMSTKFAQIAADKMAKSICDTIIGIVSCASITGTIKGMVTGKCAIGPVVGINSDILTGEELKLN